MGVISKRGIRGGGGGERPGRACQHCDILNSRQSVVKQGFQKTHFPILLKLETFFTIDLVNILAGLQNFRSLIQFKHDF